MNYLKFDLGKVKEGKRVKVALSGSIVNVRLLNNSNMYNYEHNHEYKCYGDLADKALFEMKIPSDDHWFVVVDTKGIKKTEGKIDASVRVE